MMDKEQAFLNPAEMFQDPQEVIKQPALSKEDKIKILEQWAQDIKELMTATEENMPSDMTDDHTETLEKITHALDNLK